MRKPACDWAGDSACAGSCRAAISAWGIACESPPGFVDVAAGAVVRTAKVDGRIDELFALQDLIVAELTTELDLDDGVPGFVRRPGGDTDEVPAAAPAPRGTRPTIEGGEPATSSVSPSDPRDVTGGIVVGEPAREAPGRDAARRGSDPAGVASGAGILTGRPSVSCHANVYATADRRPIG